MKKRNAIVACLLVLVLLSATICAQAAGITLKQTGSQVEEIQLKLIALGYMDNSCKLGYFGTTTKNAVIQFQKDHGLTADGVVGSKTVKKLESNLDGVDITAVYGPGDVGEEVSALQLLLVQEGYLSSLSVSGCYGQVTTNAVIKFQNDNKLSADGIAGRRTLAKLLGVDLNPPKPEKPVGKEEDYSEPDKKALDAKYATLNAKQKDEIYLLAQLITAESGGQPYVGQVAVGSVVINRMESYEKSMRDVIFAKNAFSVAKNGKINATPTKQCTYAAIESYFGAKPVSTALFFNHIRVTDSWAAKNRDLYKIIADHAFYI